MRRKGLLIHLPQPSPFLAPLFRPRSLNSFLLSTRLPAGRTSCPKKKMQKQAKLTQAGIGAGARRRAGPFGLFTLICFIVSQIRR